MQQVIVYNPDIEGLFPSCLLWKFMLDPVKYLLSVTVIDRMWDCMYHISASV